jgi:hypothetical protein
VLSGRLVFLWILNTTNYHHDALAELASASVGKVLSGRLVFLASPTPQTTTTMHLVSGCGCCDCSLVTRRI